MKCKKCGRKLTSKISQEREYGATCFRIVSLEKKEAPKVENSELQFLKMEINMLKRQMREIRTNGIKPTKGIERIQERTTHINSKEQIRMTNVVKEMKALFNETNGDYRAILHSIEPNTQIIEPPTIYI